MNIPMSAFIRDCTGRCCPECQLSDDIRYTEVPPEYGQYTRDYECQNCGCEWMMKEPA